MSHSIQICGDGLAACCCAALLERPEFDVAVEASSRPKLPAILTSQSTYQLLSDIFEDRAIFNGFHRIHQRRVAWGGETIAVPHEATVVSEQALLDRLWPKVRTSAPLDPVWTILTSRSQPQLEFGTRVASIACARLRTGTPHDACWIEAAEDGWLFLLPLGAGQAILISVGSPESRVIHAQIDQLTPAAAQFPAYPRVLSQCYGDNWIACGSAAMSFDPICGEGAGNAAREAILAAAVICAIARGEPHERVLAHYQNRLLNGFRKHLEICLDFYRQARQGPWWEREIDLLNEGIAWTKQQLAETPAPQYRLAGFELLNVRS